MPIADRFFLGDRSDSPDDRFVHSSDIRWRCGGITSSFGPMHDVDRESPRGRCSRRGNGFAMSDVITYLRQEMRADRTSPTVRGV